MGQYRVLAGQHAQLEPRLNDRGEPMKDEQGRPLTQTKVYNAGQVVSSEADLCATFVNKFERMPEERQGRRSRRGAEEGGGADEGSPSPLVASGPQPRTTVPTPQPLNPAAFPGGQVSSGYQQAVSSPGAYDTPSCPVEPGVQPAFAGPSGTKEGGSPRMSQAELAKQGGGNKGALPVKSPGGPVKPAQASGEEGEGSGGAKGAAYTREELEEMTVADLKELAEEEEVDLAGATRKDEIIDAILAGQK
jgi:hypothetical protein